MIALCKKLRAFTLFNALFMLVSCGGDSVPQSDRYPDTVEESKKILLHIDSGDFAHHELDYSLVSEALPNINSNKNEVRFNRVVDHSTKLQHSAKASFSTTSRRFKVAATAEQLVKGVTLPISSDAAVVRVIPLDGADKIDNSKLKVMREGQWLSAEQAFDAVADQDALNSVGLTSVKNTLAMRLKSSKVQSPSLQLKVEDFASNKGGYMLHVIEPQSDKVLNMSVRNTKLKQGDSLHLELKLSRSEQPLPIHHVDGFILAPRESERIPVKLDITDGKVSTEIHTNTLKTAIPGLWEVHVTSKHADQNAELIRSAKVAFSLSPKTARMGSDVIMSPPAEHNGGTLRFDFDVDVALAGRYELSAVLYGANNQGVLKPGISLSVARWLHASEKLSLVVSADQLSQASIAEPFELRHLVLKDQSRMAELWSQEHTLATAR